MIWLLLLLSTPDWTNQVDLVGHLPAHYHLCSGKSNMSAAFESKILLSEENQYNLNITATHSQMINLRFDSNSTAILVFEIIVQSAFDMKTLNNDIALLELKSEDVFEDNVQPTYLWHINNNTLLNKAVFAKEVGWGTSHRDVLSSTLQQITVPMASEVTFFKNKLFFLNKKLHSDNCFVNSEKTTCHGDSGGVLTGWGVATTTKVKKCHWPAFWLVVCPWYGMHHCQSR